MKSLCLADRHPMLDLLVQSETSARLFIGDNDCTKLLKQDDSSSHAGSGAEDQGVCATFAHLCL